MLIIRSKSTIATALVIGFITTLASEPLRAEKRASISNAAIQVHYQFTDAQKLYLDSSDNIETMEQAFDYLEASDAKLRNSLVHSYFTWGLMAAAALPAGYAAWKLLASPIYHRYQRLPENIRTLLSRPLTAIGYISGPAALIPLAGGFVGFLRDRREVSISWPNWFIQIGGAFLPDYRITRYFKSWSAISRKEPVRIVEAKFLVRSKTIPRAFRELIAKELYSMRTKGGNLEEFEKEFNMIINFPTTAKVPVIDEASFSQLARNYDPKMIDSLKNIALQYRAELDVSSESFLPKKSLFFFGLPGTGKSVLAKKFADAIGTSYCKLSLADSQISDFIGFPVNDIKMANFGRLRKCLSEKGHLNPVLIFDDVDRSFNSSFLSFFLELIDPDLGLLSTPFGELDISKCIVIFTGNFSLKTDKLRESSEEMDALLQRFTKVFNFRGYTEDYKKNFLVEELFVQLEETFGPSGRDAETLAKQAISQTDDPGMRAVIEEFKAVYHGAQQSNYTNKQATKL